MKEVRTRFAPSPTGFLHVGGVRTALFAWLLARQAKGEFLLRIEDTDRSRHVKESEQHIIDSLSWLGIVPDGKPIRQSERLDIYKEWAEKLIASGRAYADTRSPGELQEIREAAAKAKKPVLFREHRPLNPPEWEQGVPLRFKSEPKAYEWNDAVMGKLSTGPEVVDDFIIIKSDGFPTYNFAHIVDDHLMKITHVIRSQEFLSSVPKYLNLYEALGIEEPVLATLPYVMAPDGKKKLSKRDGAKDVLDYAREGYLPEAMVNFIATLGWNDGTEQEIFSVNELVKKFSLDRVQKGGAKFDEQRLNWMDGAHIRQKPIEELYKDAENFWPKEAGDYESEYKQKVLSLVQERLKYLGELPELTAFFFKRPTEGEVLKLFKPKSSEFLKGNEFNDVEFVKKVYESLSKCIFKRDEIKKRLDSLLNELDTVPALLFSVIRIAVTGSPSSPEISGVLEVLGKEESLSRLEATIKALETDD